MHPLLTHSGARALLACTLLQQVDARKSAAMRSITQSELAECHVDTLSEQIASVLGITNPTLTRDRRELIDKWHAQQKRMRFQKEAPSRQ